MGAFPQDLQYAMRRVKRAPLVTCLMVLELSVGIALNAGMFTMIAGFWPMVRERAFNVPARRAMKFDAMVALWQR
jgi:hypothetical protein